jgi:ABC-type antimicrobial peptide transport system permease subunit
VSRVDPSFAVRDYASLGDIVAAGLARERLLAALSSAFGALAAALSAMGVLGLTGYLATRRKHEIGVRLALGCSRSRAMRLVMREVVWLSAAGAIAGAGLYLASSRYLRSELYDLSVVDPATVAGAIVLLILLTVAAAYVPARRAARVDPAVTLRAE